MYFILALLIATALSACSPKATLSDSIFEAQQFNIEQNADFKNPLSPDLKERFFRGEESAKIVLVVYSDFRCPFCKRGNETIEKIRATYPKDVKVYFKHMPLETRSPSELASRYFECIALQNQGKAWAFHDALFKNQEKLGRNEESFMREIAMGLKVDMKKLKSSLNTKPITDLLKSDDAEITKFNFSGAPSYLVGGVRVRGARSYEEFKKIIDRQLGNVASSN